MKHTKGPWIKTGIGDFIWIIDNKENYIAEVICNDEEGHYIADDSEREANAHLIAAAPELLSRCKKVLQIIENNMSQGKPMDDSAMLLLDIINKAEGN